MVAASASSFVRTDVTTANALQMAMFKPPVHDEFVINLDAGKCLGARLGMIVRTVGRRTAWTASSSRRRAKKSYVLDQ